MNTIKEHIQLDSYLTKEQQKSLIELIDNNFEIIEYNQYIYHSIDIRLKKEHRKELWVKMNMTGEILINQYKVKLL